MANIEIPKFWLEQEYLQKQRSLQEIAFDLKISTDVLRQTLRTYGIKINTSKKTRLINKEWLIEEYVNKQRSATEIAEEKNCSYSLINRRLRKYGIVERSGEQMSELDLSGKTFGKWKVIAKISGKNFCQWQCKCICGNLKILSTYSLTSGASKGCWLCNGSYEAEEKHIITAHYWSSLQKGALKRKINFNIDKDYIADLYERQNRRCALTGMRLNMADTLSAWKEGKQTASLDRIDSLRPYENGNVQWVHKMVNLAKWDMPQDEFIQMCNLVARQHPVNITEESSSPEITEEDIEVSEWDSGLWRWASERVEKRANGLLNEE